MSGLVDFHVNVLLLDDRVVSKNSSQILISQFVGDLGEDWGLEARLVGVEGLRLALELGLAEDGDLLALGDGDGQDGVLEVPSVKGGRLT